MDTLPQISQDELDSRYGVAAFVDVETTGLDPARHEVLELAIVLFAFNREDGTIVGILDEYVGLREPSRRIPSQATAVHGITRKMVKGRRLDDARIRALLDQAEFLVAHNARFDYGFVSRLYPETAQKTWLCSMRGVDWKRHGYASRGLQNLLTGHGIRVDEAHRAGADSRAALALLNHRGRGGQTYFWKLLQDFVRPAYGEVAAAAEKTAAKRPKVGETPPGRQHGAGCATALLTLLMVVTTAGYLLLRP